MIQRTLKEQLIQSFRPGFVVGLFGARRTGKSVLMQMIKDEIIDGKILFVQGEDLDAAEILSSQRLSELQKMVKGYDYLFIDEAQKIPNIAVNLKLLADNIINLKIFITGSSALGLIHQIGEPLTGRSKYFFLYAIAQSELSESYLEAQKNLNERLIFGSYPQIILEENKNSKKEILTSIRNGYLLKDILTPGSSKDAEFVLNLLRQIAFQIGNDISYSELANNLKVNNRTVQRYLDLLVDTYVLFKLYAFSGNLRKEYSKTPRFYFWDNGIRNTVINNYNNINQRDDIGRLWENYCISERLKKNHYTNHLVNHYFWRTYDRKEIDLIEESGGKLMGYEFKWKKDKISPPKIFLETYKNSSVELINSENYLEFIS